MALRDSFIKGSYLMEDDETGFVHHRKSMVRQWDGVWVHRRNHDPKHPQWWAQLAPMDGLAPSMIRTPTGQLGGDYSSAFDGAFEGPPAGGNVGVS